MYCNVLNHYVQGLEMIKNRCSRSNFLNRSQAVLCHDRKISRMHCRGKVEDAGATITPTYYRQSRKRGLSHKQRALHR